MNRACCFSGVYLTVGSLLQHLLYNLDICNRDITVVLLMLLGLSPSSSVRIFCVAALALSSALRIRRNANALSVYNKALESSIPHLNREQEQHILCNWIECHTHPFHLPPPPPKGHRNFLFGTINKGVASDEFINLGMQQIFFSSKQNF